MSEAWARGLPVLAALAILVLTARLARLLWPEARELARYAPLVLTGTIAFAFSITLVASPLWLALAVLIAMWALALHWRQRDMRSFLLLGAGLALGLLAGGMAALVYVLPMALAAPLWARGGPRLRWRHWYADLAKALALAAAVLASWLAAAAKTAGIGYALAWFTDPLTWLRLEPWPARGPWWWPLAMLPVAFVPWSLLPLLWGRVWRLRHAPLDPGFGFCLFWIWLALAARSWPSASPKPQWLLALLPAGALAASWLWLHDDLREIGAEGGLWGLSLPLMVLGSAILEVPKLPRPEGLPAFLWEISPLAGVGVIVLGVALAFLPPAEMRRRLRETAAANALLVVPAVLALGLLWGTSGCG